MTAPWRHAADRLVAALRGVFGDRLRSVVAYGSHLDNGAEGPLTSLALVGSVTVADLEACARMSPDWQRERIAAPLILPEDEFRRSLDAFPLEYGEIMRAHELVFGINPFDGISIAREDLRRACETQIKSHLVHLREGYIESGGRPRAVADLVTASAPAFGALLRNLARLHGADLRDRATATREGARMAHLPDSVVTDILSLERPSGMNTTDPARLFPEYLAAVEQLARVVDAWRA